MAAQATETGLGAIKTRQQAMWASGDYPSMVDTFLLPLGPKLVEACGGASLPEEDQRHPGRALRALPAPS